ncbi:MAG TPA: HAMP domain-containing sensor histidine kinase [Candidatus Dormibacteraeota bacterium]
MYAVIFAACGVVLVVVTFLLTANGDVLFPGLQIFSGGQSGQTMLPSGGFASGSTIIATSPAPLNAQQVHSAILVKQAQTLSQLVVSAAIALGVMLVIAAVLSWLAAGRVLRPIRAITATAQRLSQQNLQQRIALDGPRDELRDLAETIDAMLDRLAAAFEAQRRFVANASHELRTPLTRERALVDVTLADPKAGAAALRAMGERVRVAVDEQERLIDGLLTLAQGERGVERHEHLDLAEVTARALDAAQGVAVGVALTRHLEPSPVLGDPELLERVAANLVDNALTHNVDGGSVVVTTGVREGHSLLRIENTGPVIPAEVVPVLFEPFRRRGRDRAGRQRGHGLGLSIVAAVVAAHGGTVEARPRAGGGLEVEVRLPT